MNIENRLSNIKKRFKQTAEAKGHEFLHFKAELESYALLDVEYLLSIIESLEQDLSIIANSENVTSMNSIADDALKLIREG